ncbi:efflux RND transporter periplasmic adaptor subunit [Actibacterium pelagium]|uniref:Membrane protein n=1 Tax=Actibacterium pelagium TaxID=2029103 RepID=A0A917EMY2_9RHOB|nr:HlyD family efflux transporter periplasmic adaptor subunit [Actibacterium pelagium]GGE62541.1 membrane protein [Actibacterium pelagium]
MKAKTLIVGGCAVVALGGLLSWGFRADPAPVDLAEVVEAEMMITVNADGKTRIRNVYEVAAPITGRAKRSPVAVGDPVVSGETVVAVVQPVAPSLLDSRSRASAEAAIAEAEAALRVAQSQVRQAEEDLTLSQSNFARTAELVSRGVATTSQLEGATQLRAIKQAALEAAQSSQAMAEGSLARARAALIQPDVENPADDSCCVVLHAPSDGVVLSIQSISERPVTMGAPLLTIGRREDLEIVADLLSADAVKVAPGARAIVERWGGDDPLEAVLSKIEPSARTKVSALGIEEQRVDVVFDLLSPPEDRPGLGDGFAVFLRVLEWEGQDILQVPLSAVFRNNGNWYAFRAEGSVLRQVPVTLGRMNSHVAQVLDGLSPGDRVVVHPSDRVSDGIPFVDRAELE